VLFGLIPSEGRFSVLLASSHKRVYGLVKLLKGDG
jgi:hypothetical protein